MLQYYLNIANPGSLTDAEWALKLKQLERMSRADQLKAYQYINKYLAGLGAGIGIKYAETYLNSELWNN